MEGVIALIIISWLVSTMGKNAKKQKKAASSPVKNRLMKETEAAQSMPKDAPVQSVMEEMLPRDLGEGESFPEPQEPYAGSMMAHSTEGEDICDPALEHARPQRIDPQSVYANEIGAQPLLDLSPRGVYQGVVMSEILQRRKGSAWKKCGY